MTFIHNKSNFEIFDFLIFRCSFLKPLTDQYLHLLNCCNDHLPITGFQFFLQIIYIVRLIHIHQIIVRISLKCHGCLCIQIFTVYQEYCFINSRNIHQKITGSFIRSQCLARSCCMPYKTGFTCF